MDLLFWLLLTVIATHGHVAAVLGVTDDPDALGEAPLVAATSSRRFPAASA